MKTIRLSIEEKYTDGRKNDYFYDEGPLNVEHNSFATDELTSYRGYKHIDFKNGDIETQEGDIVHSGVPFKIEQSFIVTTICYKMEDDGVSCNEDTLYIHLECFNSKNGKKQEVDLPYRKGASVVLNPHPYQVTVLDLNNEEVILELKNGDKVTNYLVQLYNFASQNDEEYYATGNPNDPVDTAGPYIYMSLLRR